MAENILLLYNLLSLILSDEVVGTDRTIGPHNTTRVVQSITIIAVDCDTYMSKLFVYQLEMNL